VTDWLAADRDWTSIPAVQLLGVLIGVLLLVAAIRALFGKR
jgi:hypothetical protein